MCRPPSNPTRHRARRASAARGCGDGTCARSDRPRVQAIAAQADAGPAYGRASAAAVAGTVVPDEQLRPRRSPARAARTPPGSSRRSPSGAGPRAGSSRPRSPRRHGRRRHRCGRCACAPRDEPACRPAERLGTADATATAGTRQRTRGRSSRGLRGARRVSCAAPSRRRRGYGCRAGRGRSAHRRCVPGRPRVPPHAGCGRT